MYSSDERDTRPGISALLATHDRQVDLHAAVLDLAAVLDGLVYENFEIIIVEEEVSSTRTSDILAGLLARCPRLPLRILEQRHTDRSVALAEGFAAAAYDLIFVGAADGQFDVRELNHLLEAIEHGADLAVGYRGRRIPGWNLVKRLLGKNQIGDYAFKLVRRVVVQQVGQTFCADLLARARQHGFHVAELPVSKHRARDAAAGAPVSIGSHAA